MQEVALLACFSADVMLLAGISNWLAPLHTYVKIGLSFH
jgi:hypothetical protein